MDQKIDCVLTTHVNENVECFLTKYVEGRVTPIIVSKGAPDAVMDAFYAEINNMPLLEKALFEKRIVKVPYVNMHFILYAVKNPGTDRMIPYRLIEYKETCGKKEINLFNIQVLSEISTNIRNYREKPLFDAPHFI